MDKISDKLWHYILSNAGSIHPKDKQMAHIREFDCLILNILDIMNNE